MVCAPHLDLHIDAVRRMDPTFIPRVCVGTHKFKVMPKMWDSNTDLANIPAVRQ
jgi:hypothetical protein